MTVSALGFFGLSARKPRTQRLLYYITGAMTLIAAISYFAMGSNLGWTGIRVEFSRSDPKEAGRIRQIFYVRYIDWFLTTPLLLMDLLFTCALPAPTICFTILMSEVAVICGLVGALIKSTYKWGFFTFGVAAFLFVAWNVVFEGLAHAKVLGADIRRTYLICSLWTVSIWLLYPIAWGCSEGGNVIPPDSEAIFYGILDILTKPVFGVLLLWGLRNLDLNQLGINIRDPADSPLPVSEKHAPNGTTNGITNGVTNGALTHTDASAVTA